MGMGDRIRERRLSLGLTQEELATKLGLQKSAIAKYENGRVENIKRSVIFEMSKILKCSPVNLLCLSENECEEPSLVSDQDFSLINKYNKLDQTGKEIIEFILEKELQRTNTICEKETRIDFLKSSTKSTAQNPPANIIMRTYPYFSKIACAGKGFYFDDIPVETMEVPFLDGADFVIGVNGDSMEPDYSDGDIVYVRKTTNLKQGEVGIFTIGNECFIKELGGDRLISKNKSYSDIKGTEDVRLIGKVIGKL